MNEKFLVDNGKQFDFGKASEKYAKYRDIYPEELFQRLHEIGVGVKDSNWLDLGTGTGVVPRGMAKFGADEKKQLLRIPMDWSRVSMAHGMGHLHRSRI